MEMHLVDLGLTSSIAVVSHCLVGSRKKIARRMLSRESRRAEEGSREGDLIGKICSTAFF